MAERCFKNVGGFVFWGALINLVLIYYLPGLVATFITLVGMAWYQGGMASTMTYVWALLMLNVWVMCPLIMLAMLYRNRT